MVKVVASHVVRESQIDEFVETGKQMIQISQNDAGNVHYTLNRNVQNPNVFVILEMWESQEALAAHMETSHFKKYAPLMGSMLEEEPAIEIYEEV
ncbi:putative quinol monooxygenase [Adlercreutzia sp. ZJ138]|uniref:putative quinol monooxygenase n=1 Tax=Adlercreutzia sp. ZJ138 TaxID=2709405 RepID=UPI0013E9B842|nr:putative quinol monooxygenase [Adlercreutzia sp. ZJ138]